MSSEKPAPKPVGAQLIIPVAGLVFTLYYFWSIRDSPWEAQAAAFLVGTILMGLIVAFLVRTFWQWRAGTLSFAFEADFLGTGGLLARRLGLVALTVGYAVVIGWLGFTLTTFVFLTSAMLLLGANKRPATTVGLAALIALLGWLVFIVAFDTRFPRGPFETLMRGMIG